MKFNPLKIGIIFGLSVTSANLCAGEISVPNVFIKGEPARASEVNDNFSVLANGVNSNARGIQLLQAAGGLPRVIVGDSNQQIRDASSSEFLDMDSLQLPSGNWHVSFYMELHYGNAQANGECKISSQEALQGGVQQTSVAGVANRTLFAVVTGPATVNLQCKKHNDSALQVIKSTVLANEIGSVLRAEPNGISSRNTPE